MKTIIQLLFCTALTCSSAFAQQVSVTPLRVLFKGEQQSDVITMRNTSKEAFTVQPKVVKWSQKDGVDVFEPTRDILVAPPIVEIGAGESQVIRLALRRAPDASQELSYRIFLQQVGVEKKGNSTGVSFAWNLSLPIFVLPTVPAIADLQWAAQANGKTISLTATNPSLTHVQIKKIKLESSVGTSEVGQMFYLLPGQQGKVVMPAPAGAIQKVTVIADTDAGEIRREVMAK
jgi:fimbrial chaperone protein